MHLRSIIPFLLAATLLSSNFLAAQSPALLDPGRQSRLETLISSTMARENIPGVSVAIVLNKQVVLSNGFGLADLENFVPVKSSTVFRLGSISKPITAVAALQLWEKNRLDLDAPVQRYCSSFPYKRWPLTARQLLAHLAGIRHYQGNEFFSTRHYSSVEEGLEIFKYDPLLHEPGTKFLYTSYGYNLLGCAMEGAAGMRFMDYLRENIFRKAAMSRIQADNVYEIIYNRAQGYQKNQAGQLRNSGLADTSYKIPSGGLSATAEDLARFAIALQEGSLLRPGTIEMMWTPQKNRAGQYAVQSSGSDLQSFGLGWHVAMRNGQKEIWHPGGQQRVSTALFIVPGKQLAVVILCNLENAPVIALAREISDILLQSAR